MYLAIPGSDPDLVIRAVVARLRETMPVTHADERFAEVCFEAKPRGPHVIVEIRETRVMNVPPRGTP